MNDHPVFLNSKSVSVYFGLWILIAGIHFSIFYLFYAFPIDIAVSDSLVFNVLFCIIGITLWYVVRYSIPDNRNRWNVLFNHVTFLTLILVVWYGISYTLLGYLFNGIKAYKDFLVVSIPYRIFIGILFYALLGMAYYLIIYYRNLQDKILLEARLSELLKESELNTLKSQIKPHFLFNSLNSISSLTITNPEKAREMVIKLSDFLRYSVSINHTNFTTFEKEIANVKRYLEIEKVRFGEKLDFEFNLEGECKDHEIPVMLLQPIFENAIKHGVYESTERVKIEMDCEYRSGYLEISIVNDFDPEARPRKGAGMGLKNIRERLRLLYKTDKLIKTSVEGNKYRVLLSLPGIKFNA